MIETFKKYFKTFYFYVAVITILAVTVLGFMYFWGNGLFQPKSSPEKIYYADNISATHKLLINKFNKLHEGKIEVVPIDLPFEKFSTNERKELLIRYLRSRSDRIDIFSVDQIWVPRFAKWTEPLNKYFIITEREKIINQALNSCYYKNDLVAIPLYFDIGIMYYNDELLKKLPDYLTIKKELQNFITWERFIQIGNKLKNFGKPVYLFPADDYEGLMCSFIELLESQNNKMFIGDSIKLTTKEAEKSLQLLVDLVNKYKFSPKDILEYRETECYSRYVKEDGLFLRGWTGLNVWYKSNIDSTDISKKYLAAPLPHFNGSKPASISGGWNLMVSKYSTNKSSAVEFIKFLVSEESQKVLFEKGGYLPVNNEIYSQKEYLSKFDYFDTYKKIMRTAAYRPFLDKYTRCSDIIAYYLKESISNKIKVKDALAKAEKVINTGEIFIK